MSGVAFAWAAKSSGGGYRRSSRSIVSIVCVTVSMRRSLRVLASHDGRPATHVQRRADGQDDAAGHAVDHARGGCVPGNQSGRDPDPTAEMDPAVVGIAVGRVV